ncbi:MAG: hypothetical protein ACYCYQ_15270 [Acidimicrobiales bacterium]
MSDKEHTSVELASLEVFQVGPLREPDDVWEPFRLVDRDGRVVQAVSDYLKDLQAAGRRGQVPASGVQAREVLRPRVNLLI